MPAPDYAQRLVWETEGRRGAAERGWIGETAQRAAQERIELEAQEARRQEEERAAHEADQGN